MRVRHVSKRGHPILAAIVAMAGGITVADGPVAAEAKLFSADELFTGPDSIETKPGAVDRLKDVIQRAQPPGFECPTQVDVTVMWYHPDKIWGGTIGEVRREVLEDALRALNLPNVEYSVRAEPRIVNAVNVTADTRPDREPPKLDTNSVPRKGTKVKPGDVIRVTMVGRDQANAWQTGIKTIQLVADSEGGRFVASENFIGVPRACAGLQPERRVEASYTVPDNPPPLVRLSALAEDFVGLTDTDAGEFPTQGDWAGRLEWKAEQVSGGGRGDFWGHMDLVLTYDGQGNLHGTLSGTQNQFIGAPCNSSTLTPGTLTARLLGTYTPDVRLSVEFTDARSTPAKPGPCSYGGSPISAGSIHTWGHLRDVLRNPTRAADGSYQSVQQHAIPGGPGTVQYKLTLRPVGN
ncbi:MAG TPA: hypothetical protein VH743_09380 [Beijerinckiaceae bacterium]|jgi:hypothetical protein